MTTLLRVLHSLLLLVLLFLGQAQECVEEDGTCADQAPVSPCRDLADRKQCESKKSSGECESNPDFMFEHCAETCGVCFGSFRPLLGIAQHDRKRTVQNLTQTVAYVAGFRANPAFEAHWDACATSHRHQNCIFWASAGECNNNPSYMTIHCAAACRRCELLDITVRCPMEKATPNVWGPGDLGKFFANLTNKVNHDYDVNILSKPPEGPWVVTIDDFLSENEANRLIELGRERGFKRSFGNGGTRPDGTSIDLIVESRTSSNTFCQEECFKDPTATEIRHRIANLTNTPPGNHEHFQLLHYDVGQYYAAHHDFIPFHVNRQPGPRILTVFLYLNDVEEGGGTAFPLLNLVVAAKRGRALIWSHVLDESPLQRDDRTDHEALPVIKGVKYGANSWIHQRDYISAHHNNCQ